MRRNRVCNHGKAVNVINPKDSGECTLTRDAILRGAQITYNGLCPLITCQSFGLDKKLSNPIGLLNFLEVPPGIEPGIEVLQTFALPLGHGTVYFFFLQNYGHENFYFRARFFGADYGARTRHLDLGKVALYQMS